MPSRRIRAVAALVAVRSPPVGEGKYRAHRWPLSEVQKGYASRFSNRAIRRCSSGVSGISVAAEITSATLAPLTEQEQRVVCELLKKLS